PLPAFHAAALWTVYHRRHDYHAAVRAGSHELSAVKKEATRRVASINKSFLIPGSRFYHLPLDHTAAKTHVTLIDDCTLPRRDVTQRLIKGCAEAVITQRFNQRGDRLRLVANL